MHPPTLAILVLVATLALTAPFPAGSNFKLPRVDAESDVARLQIVDGNGGLSWWGKARSSRRAADPYFNGDDNIVPRDSDTHKRERGTHCCPPSSGSINTGNRYKTRSQTNSLADTKIKKKGGGTAIGLSAVPDDTPSTSERHNPSLELEKRGGGTATGYSKIVERPGGSPTSRAGRKLMKKGNGIATGYSKDIEDTASTSEQHSPDLELKNRDSSGRWVPWLGNARDFVHSAEKSKRESDGEDAEPDASMVEYGLIARRDEEPDASMVEYALLVEPDVTAIEYKLKRDGEGADGISGGG